jgi:UDP-glucose 4-epimerase
VSIGNSRPSPVTTIRSAGDSAVAAPVIPSFNAEAIVVPARRPDHRRYRSHPPHERRAPTGMPCSAVAAPGRSGRSGLTLLGMGGVRVLVSGMGGELGSRVASLLEDEPWVGSLEGIDVDPPRRRLRRAVFHRIVAGQHDRIVAEVTRFNPHVLVHVAVWEPHARAHPATARRLTDDAAISILGAAAECRALESIVVRSGIEIYGRRTRLDHPARRAGTGRPHQRYGHGRRHRVDTRSPSADRIGVGRGGPAGDRCSGPHVPSPLGRFLRLPAVPFSALADPPFAVIHKYDAAAAFVAAARVRLDEPVNVVAPGAITMRSRRSGAVAASRSR